MKTSDAQHHDKQFRFANLKDRVRAKKPKSKYSRCKGCGGKVILPCILCGL